MRMNEEQLHDLVGLRIAGGVDNFREPLGAIFLPPDPDQRPSVDFIRRANALRRIDV
jgi:hypothetical protein